MSKSNTTENDLMLLIFNKTLPAYLGTLNTTGNTDLYVSLHTADPTDTGVQNTSEATYNGGAYGRVAVVRTAGGWTVSGNQASNTAIIQFALCTSGSDTITYVGIGTAASGAGQLLYSGQLNSPRTISNGIQPQFSPGDLIFQED